MASAAATCTSLLGDLSSSSSGAIAPACAISARLAAESAAAPIESAASRCTREVRPHSRSSTSSTWLRARTGRSRPVGRFLWVGGRRYPLKATGYLAAQLAGGIERTDGNPVKVDRVIRALCRVGFDVT